MSIDLSEWYTASSLSKSASQVVPVMSLADDLVKGSIRKTPAERAPKSAFTDPLAFNYAMGFKHKRDSMPFDMMRRVSQQLSLVAAILQTRCNQIASFSAPFRQTKSLGFVIKHKDPSHLTTRSEQEFIKDLENFVLACGHPVQNPHTVRKRDDLETFLKKIVRDSLMYDQCTFEVVPDRRGRPFEFLAVDASTIRIAGPEESLIGPNSTWIERESQELKGAPYKMRQMYEYDPANPPAYIQLVNGQVENVYQRDELAMGIRNPRTDIYIQGYGYGEIEQLVNILTSHLYAEEYNRRFFMQGSAPKGILNFKGENFTGEMLETFRRQWKANVEGVENAWRTPILQAEQGVEWINLNPSNKDMEYGQWMEYLIKITSAVFLIDPAELNFDLHGGVQQTPLFESSQEWKLKASRDKGLKPLLRFIEKLINEHVIDKIDDHFTFQFVGLDELTEQEKHELRKEQMASYMTLNEIRRAEDLDDMEFGDYPMNPTYIQMRGQMLQEEQQKAQQQAMGAAPAPGAAAPGAAPGAAPAPTGATGEPVQPATSGTTPYADNFGKSFVEIQLDEWVDDMRQVIVAKY